jgi:hypothetical protein
MEKLLRFILTFTLIALMHVSCDKEDDFFDKSLLTGKWKSGTLYYRYFDNGTGKTWDTKDDIDESEAQTFNWTLDNSTLTHIHTGGVTVPKIYTLTELTSTNLRYRDQFLKSFSYTREN